MKLWKSVLIIVVLNFNLCFSQVPNDTGRVHYSQSETSINIDMYVFEFGESSENFLLKYPEFQVDEYIDEDRNDLVVKYYFDYAKEDVTINVLFFNNELFELNISDEFWSGIFTDFIPENFGFIKVSEERTYFDEMYPNALVELYYKDNYKLYFRNGRYGYLSISDESK